tara:strand:- start:531 stop:1274 length:744 start_codon:yes stop_codon:yes gene_type:complete
MIIANWKCNGSKSMINQWWREFSKIHNETHNTFVGIAPPAIYIQYLESFTSRALSDIKIGSQDIDISSGARTGGISAEMMMDFDCKFSIIGHSERRQFFNENNDDIRQKILNIINKKITVLCIGETEDENNNNLTKDVIESQLEVIRDMDFKDSLVVAYEPVWSIGSGNTAQPDKINEIHNFIKDVVQSISINSAIPIVIYGGSVNEDNAESFFNEEFIDGALIGGASLNGKQFANIINIYNEINSL